MLIYTSRIKNFLTPKGALESEKIYLKTLLQALEMEKKGLTNDLMSKSKELENVLNREKSAEDRAFELTSITSQNSEKNEQLLNEIAVRDQKIISLNKSIETLKGDLKCDFDYYY